MPSPQPRLRDVAVPLGVLRASGQGLEFIGFVVLARRLGTSEFGQLSVAYLVCRYAGLLADWGASLQGPRDVATGRHPHNIRSLVRHRSLVTAALVAIYVAVVWAMGMPSLIPLALCIAGRGLNRDWISLGRQRGLRSGVPPFLQGALMAVGVLFVHSLGGAALVIGAAWGISVVASLALNRLPAADQVGPAPTSSSNDPWFLILLVADQIYASMDVVLLAVLASTSEAGIYSAVYRFPNAWITVMGLVVVGVLPGVARTLAADPTQLPRLRGRALRVGGSLSLVLLALTPLCWLLLPVVFGADYRPGRGPLVLLLVATAANTATVGLQPIYFSRGDERRLATWASLTAAVNIGLNLVLIPHFGATGAASVTLLSQLMISGYYLTTTGRMARALGRASPGPEEAAR